MPNARAAAVCLLTVVGVAGCARKVPPTPEASSSAASSVDAGAALVRPRTTSASIALGNLSGEIAQREESVKKDPGDVDAARALVDLLLSRGEYDSRIADYDRAHIVARAARDTHPESESAHLAYAATLGTFHRFEDALHELDAAEKAGARPDVLKRRRATIAMAQGRYDDADAIGAYRDVDVLPPMDLATAAVLTGERGDAAGAERLFERARAAYRDVSPFPVAWIDFQRGALLERHGDRTRARAYFEEAHEVLPGFTHPAVHLAGLVPPAAAVTVLEPLVGKSDDPQVDAAYGDALRRVGRAADGQTAIQRARLRYEQLLTRHPEAFADHGAAFYLGPGHDARRALALARANAEDRHTEASASLWLTAALAAGAREEACAAAKASLSLPYVTPDFRAMRDADDLRCGR
jgi:tetratricopeptide (TPR) repeat protein